MVGPRFPQQAVSYSGDSSYAITMSDCTGSTYTDISIYDDYTVYGTSSDFYYDEPDLPPEAPRFMILYFIGPAHHYAGFPDGSHWLAYRILVPP